MDAWPTDYLEFVYKVGFVRNIKSQMIKP